MSTTLFNPSSDVSVPRSVAFGLAGAAAFGLAAGLGHGAGAMLQGAWMSPTLFVGGALLATPPLYLASTYSGSRASAEEVVTEVSSVLGNAGLVLLGLTAPVAYFSATLRTVSAWGLLLVTAVVVGATAVRSIARRTLSHGTSPAILWTLFALALGVRLLVSLSHQIPSSPLVTS